MVNSKSNSFESVGSFHVDSKLDSFQEADEIPAPLARSSKVDGKVRNQAARTPTTVEFAASIAHEVRQPLASVVLNAEATLRWLARDDPDLDEARHAISNVAREGIRAGEMIEGLLTLVRQSQPVFAVCNINDVIHDVLTRINEERQQHGVLLSLNLFTDNWRVFGSRAQLQHVLFNLAVNSIEGMTKVSDRPRVLTISVEPTEKAGVLVTVGDTGPGLDPAIADRIFEPFVTSKPAGMGMGLSICRSIIEAYGGRIWASPREVCGTIFRFILPAATSPEAGA